MPAIPDGAAPRLPTTKNSADRVRRRLSQPTQPGVLASTDPVCRLVLGSDAALAAAVDSYAQNTWVVGEDPDHIATISTAAGTLSYITVPLTGRYSVSTRGIFRNPTSATGHVAFVTRGSASASSSIVRAKQNTGDGAGADGTIVYGERRLPLTAGDILYWGHWTGLACTLQAVNFGVPTEIGLYWWGNR